MGRGDSRTPGCSKAQGQWTETTEMEGEELHHEAQNEEGESLLNISTRDND